jgi:putative spermidine/putrescine transport system permease protein
VIPALRGKWLALLCLLPFALFFIAFQIAPLLWVASNSLHTSEGWSLGNFSEAFSSPFYRQAMRHSLEVAFWSSLIGISIAILGSYSLRQVDSKLRDFVMAFSNMTSNFSGVPLA